VNIGLPGFSQPERKARKTLSKKKTNKKQQQLNLASHGGSHL
jgi:hypothetical protein